MFARLRQDIKSIKARDPAARNAAEILLLYSGFHALLWYRVSHRLHRWRLRGLARFVSQLGRFFTQIEIHPAAKIGRALFIDHGSGVVIGETCEIGDNVTIYQGVTLGGTGKSCGKRHPTIEDDVVIGAGALVLGGFTVGKGAKIAAGAVVLDAIPPNSTAVGVPAKVIKIDGERVTDVDDRLIPDPVRQELCCLRKELEQIKRKLIEGEDK